MDENKALWERYSRMTHILGRVSSLITLVLLVGAPFLIGKYLGAYPDLGATARAIPYAVLLYAIPLCYGLTKKYFYPPKEKKI